VGASPGSVRRPLAAAVLALAIAGCGASPTSPSPTLSPSPTASPSRTLAPTSAPSPTPAHGTFTATGSIAISGEGETATLLRDGRVLFVGAEDANFKAITEVEIYDPATGTFTLT